VGSGGPQQFGGLDDLLGSLTGGRSGTSGSSGAGAQGGLGGIVGSGVSGGGGLASIAMTVLSMLMSQRGGQGSSGGLGGALGGGGGLGGLLEKLQQGGLGNQTRSWVEPGQNESISATQVRDALGDDTVNEVAARAGVSREEAADGLAGLLPQLVDRLTPEGRVPDENQLRGMLSGLAPK
jgi:uncharacterized protein YidB (DUF937 family)